MEVQKVQEIKVVEDWVSPDGKYALHKGEQATYLPEIEEPGTYRVVLDVGVMARIPKYYFESPIITRLKEYIDNATPEMLAKDWEELKPFNGSGQDAAEYLQDQYDKNILAIVNAYKEWLTWDIQKPMLIYIKEKLRNENQMY